MKKFKYKPKVQNAEKIIQNMSKRVSQDITKVANEVAKKRGRPQKTTRELQQEVNKLIKEANRRLSRLEKSGKAQQSSAYRSLQEERGTKPRFEKKGKSRKALEQQLKELKGFTKKKSSTLRGTKDIVAKQKEELERQGITFDSENEEKEFFELFGDFMSRSKQRGKKQYNSYQIKQLMYDSYKAQKQKYGYVDKKRLYANVRSKVAYWEKQQELEEEDTFERLTDRRKEQARTRSSRSR